MSSFDSLAKALGFKVLHATIVFFSDWIVSLYSFIIAAQRFTFLVKIDTFYNILNRTVKCVNL